MLTPMKRVAPYAICLIGAAALLLLVPLFNAAQPRGIRVTRADAIAAADAAAARFGIPVDRAWAILTRMESPLLEDELKNDPDRRRRAAADPTIGPRLGSYMRTFYRRDVPKRTPYGRVVVDDRNGAVLMVHVDYPNEEPGANASATALRARADAFVRSRAFPGAPSPQFESARPSVLRARTDWVFRYRAASTFPTGTLVPYLNVRFAGDRFAGWELVEEYSDGRWYRGETGGSILSALARLSTFYALLLILLIIFLKKYHAGEAGVGTGSILFAVVIALSLVFDIIVGPGASEGTSLGNLDAGATAAAQTAFKFLLYDIPLAVVVFFSWSVGESYARERWGERLASFDSILRRDGFNASVGRSVLTGTLAAPAVAAAALGVAAIPLALKMAHPAGGAGTAMIVELGGPSALLIDCLLDAVTYPVITLFLLAWSYSRRVLPIGIAAALVCGAVGAVCSAPTEPYLQHVLFGFGGIAATVAIFLAYDVLAASFALFGGAIIALAAPLSSVAHGHELAAVATVLGTPLVLAIAFAIAALMTKRKTVYTYDDLAPHVKRIVERERVKAEIDAANRIQAALLPVESPLLNGASVSSHYRAATEIGGDYFDFLLQRNGDVGIAFGDVSGHGLTSGIVMAMAKAALLVQVEHDASPAVVLNVLNDVVMKTAPKRILMTFFFGVLDPMTQTLRFSSAGHLDPYVYRCRSGRLEALSSWGFPLGVKRRDPFREHTVEFLAGDRLILYSDGLIEALDDDGEPFGFDRFERTIVENGRQSAEEIKKAVLGTIRKFTRNRPPEDDQTMVVVSFDEPAPAMLGVPAYAAVVSESVN